MPSRRAAWIARDSDRAGLAMLRDGSAWIGLRRDNGVTRVSMTNGLTMDGNWNTTGTGGSGSSTTPPVPWAVRSPWRTST